MKNNELSAVRIVKRLPRHSGCDRGDPLPRGLVGSTIVDFGTVPDELRQASHEIEGGGLVIDYRPAGSQDVRRVVFSLTEEGMWVVFQGESPKKTRRAGVRE